MEWNIMVFNGFNWSRAEYIGIDVSGEDWIGLITLCCAVLCCAVLCYSVLCCIVLYCMHCIGLECTGVDWMVVERTGVA